MVYAQNNRGQLNSRINGCRWNIETADNGAWNINSVSTGSQEEWWRVNRSVFATGLFQAQWIARRIARIPLLNFVASYEYENKGTFLHKGVCGEHLRTRSLSLCLSPSSPALYLTKEKYLSSRGGNVRSKSINEKERDFFSSPSYLTFSQIYLGKSYSCWKKRNSSQLRSFSRKRS